MRTPNKKWGYSLQKIKYGGGEEDGPETGRRPGKSSTADPWRRRHDSGAKRISRLWPAGAANRQPAPAGPRLVRRTPNKKCRNSLQKMNIARANHLPRRINVVNGYALWRIRCPVACLPARPLRTCLHPMCIPACAKPGGSHYGVHACNGARRR